MSTNPNLQQINVFSKGMNTDTSDAFLSNELYRYAENVRFIAEKSSDSTGGELCTIEGWSKLRSVSKLGKILATSVIRDNIIAIILQTDGWRVYVFDSNGNNISLKFGPCIDPIGENPSIVTRYESSKNIKVYIADGENLLMCINIGDDAPVHKKIKDVVSTLNIPLNPIIASLNNDHAGTTLAAIVLYAYSVYELGGQETNLSPLSNYIVFENVTNPDESTTCPSVNLEIDNSVLDKEKIRIYRIEYIKNGSRPDTYIIYDGDMISQYTDSGVKLSKLSEEEITSSNLKIKPVLIESKGDHLFAANISYNQQEVDSKFEEKITVEYSFYLDASYSLDLNNNVVDGEYKPSFRRGETYRFGIVIYDTEGNRSSVMEIQDKTVPDNIDIIRSIGPFNYENGEDLSSKQWSDTLTRALAKEGYYCEICPIAVSAEISFLNSKVREKISAIELVRCKRSIADSVNISQGIVGATQKIKSANTSTRLAFPYMTLYRYEVNSILDGRQSTESTTDLLMFLSPEQCYQKDDFDDIIKSYKSNSLNLHLSEAYTPPYCVYEQDDVLLIANETVPNTTNPADIQGYAFENTSGYDVLILGDYSRLNEETVTSSEVDVAQVGRCFVIKSNNGIYYGEARMDPMPWNSQVASYYNNMCSIYPMDVVHITHNNNDKVILNVKTVKSPGPRSFDNSGTVRIDEDSTNIGECRFINWDAPDFYNYNGLYTLSTGLLTYMGHPMASRFTAITAGKDCALLNIPSGILPGTYILNVHWLPIIQVASIRKSAVPYGGDSEEAKLNSVFYSHGDHVSLDRSEDDDNVDVNIISHAGDTYISMFECNSGHSWQSTTYACVLFPTVYIVPVESSIDLTKAHGDLFSKLTSDYKYFFQDEPVDNFRGVFNQTKYPYLYNTAYSIDPDVIPLYTSIYNRIYSDNYDCRIHYSNLKTNGENIDSWLKFQPLNFLDVDTRYGQITDINLFKNTLVFWQDSATGVLSVNERTILLDSKGSNIILGNGDILQRYDYITTKYGMEPGYKCKAQSDNALYWWDGNKQEILQYIGGEQVRPLKKEKTVSTYINGLGVNSKKVSLSYDPKYSEILMCLGLGSESGDEETLVYNEYIQLFTGIYGVTFDDSVSLPDRLVLINDNNFYRWNDNKDKNILVPVLYYVVNKDSLYTKVYDNVEFGMGDSFYSGIHNEENISDLKFTFKTPLKLSSFINPKICNREYDLRFAIPRAVGNNGLPKEYGDRLRGKTMLCSVTSTDKHFNFSLQYIITKYRISNS